ncbi:hypothetical protein LMG19282_01451 [Cupriavidus campinensis]|uniref:DUF3717 domain-containing protein n=1 Tax=Cupriavidus campinensis TaxID=151783 RepID=UPI001B262AC0|nr:DUF3717 domain-containing protein [Cupriavidus campinensis]CAG2138139.1 hypothetical protein LMG19282_01451 [Cupriavidus campinensis]
MKATVSIVEVEAAINAWRVRKPADHGAGLSICPEVRVLAELYGEMIFSKQTDVAVSALTERQLITLRVAIQGVGK